MQGPLAFRLGVCAYSVAPMPKFETPALEKLKLLGRGPSDIAEVFCVNQSTASRWLSGDSRPSPLQRPLMRRLYGIQEPDWLTATERARQAEVLANKRARKGAAQRDSR